MGFWAVAAPVIGSIIGSQLTASANKSAIKKQERLAKAGRERRRIKADQTLGEAFNRTAQNIGPENEVQLMESEDAKNLKAFNDTEQNSEVKIGQGLNIGGNELAEFTQLKRLADQNTTKRNNARKYFHSQFLSPNAVQGKRGNYADELLLDRNRLADELEGDQHINNMEIEAVQPDQTMLALGDAIRIGSQMYGMYNLASGLGSTGATAPVDSGMAQFTGNIPGPLPTPPPTGGLGTAFTNGASQGWSGAGELGFGVKQSIPLTKYFNYAGL